MREHLLSQLPCRETATGTGDGDSDGDRRIATATCTWRRRDRHVATGHETGMAALL
jgi:hypothetical protein